MSVLSPSDMYEGANMSNKGLRMSNSLVRISIVFLFLILFYLAFLLIDIDFDLFWLKVKWTIFRKSLRLLFSRLGFGGLCCIGVICALLDPENVSHFMGENCEKEGNPSSKTDDSLRVHPSRESGSETSYESCEASLSSPDSETEKSEAFWQQPITTEDVDCWKKKFETLLKESVPPKENILYYDRRKGYVMEILREKENKEIMDLLLNNLFNTQNKPLNRNDCRKIYADLEKDNWHSAEESERGSVYAKVWAALEKFDKLPKEPKPQFRSNTPFQYLKKVMKRFLNP